MHRKIATFLLFYLCFCTFSAFAQLQVISNNNAMQLAQTLQGAGVVITNPTINCPSLASGTFDGTASNIGIAGGVLLTTGTVDKAVGPNTSASEGQDNSINYSDPQLIAIEPKATYDACILEFDATPSCDTLGFTFSFGSEEYLEFVNGGYNDVFGIFVNGANPAGPAYVNYNVALIPTTNIAVSIDNVNTTNNPTYYVDNTSGTSVQYDGFTKPINVALRVVPCTKYHFKLAIADAGDGVYDSGVFFANHSLECNTVLSIATTSTPAQCGSNNGTATVTSVSGGTSPYSYSWNTTPVQTIATATGLSPGNYMVTIVDAGGCISGTATVVVSASGGSFPVSSSSTNALCNGANNGTATITPNGGTFPYTYVWNTNPVKTTATVSGLPVGTYTCLATDAAGCTQTATVTINEPTAVALAVSGVVDASCKGGNNGSATANAAGGTPGYVYIWNTSPVQNGATASNLTAGNYVVTATDFKGCTQTATVTINEPTAVTATVSGVDVSCKGVNDGSATVNAAGGTPGYTYVWNTLPAQSAATVSNLAAGNYVVTVTDTKGCTTTQSLTITESAAIILSTSTTPASCGTKDGTATVTASLGTAPYTYLWLTSPIQSTPTATGLGDGVYAVIVTDAKGCTQQMTSTVTGGTPPVADFIYNPDTISILDPTVNFLNQSVGNYSSSLWIFGDSASGANNSSILQHPKHFYSDTGRYCITLIIADHTGNCQDTSIKCLTVISPFTFYIPNAFTPNGNKTNDMFLGYGTNIKEFNMVIFDRWGNKVFESNNIREGWNGKMNNSGYEVQQDTYVWKVKIIDVFEMEHNYIGHVDKIN